MSNPTVARGVSSLSSVASFGMRRLGEGLGFVSQR